MEEGGRMVIDYRYRRCKDGEERVLEETAMIEHGRMVMDFVSVRTRMRWIM